MDQKTVSKALNGNFAGTVVSPGDEHWDQARAAWNLAADQNPAAVAYAESAADVAAAVDFARANGLGVAAQGTGHGAGARGPLEGSILLRTERMKGIEVDADNGVGRYEAGVLWMEANPAVGEHGLANLSGSAPDVGIVGYTTGGGFGWLARRYGLACNKVRAFELVTADGGKRRVDADNDADLFWALRGGGGSFGVVTAIEFDLAELPEVFAGSAIYPADEGSSEIINRYFEWASALPDEVTSIVRFLHLPPLPQIPEPLQDRPLITLGACYAGPESVGAELVQPIRELGEPVMDTFQTMPPSGLSAVHMEPDEPVPGLVYTASLREAPQEAIDTFIETAGPDSGSPLLSAELRQCGGALGEPAKGAGALSHLDAEYVFCGIGHTDEPGDGRRDQPAAGRRLQGAWALVDGESLLQLRRPPHRPRGDLRPETLERLRDVKRRYDPDGLISANHNISLA